MNDYFIAILSNIAVSSTCDYLSVNLLKLNKISAPPS